MPFSPSHSNCDRYPFTCQHHSYVQVRNWLYDDQTSPSNSPGPPAGGSSGRGYWYATTRGSDRPGKNDSEKQNDNLNWDRVDSDLQDNL